MARFRIDGIDVGPDDLAPQLPVECRLMKQLPGPDRPDYFLAALERPLTHRTTVEQLRAQGADLDGADPRTAAVHPDGTVELHVRGVVIAARIAGEQPYAGMERFPVSLAYVIDDSIVEDDALVFSKAAYVAVAFITDIPGEPVTPTG